jgi:GAF domain-containing protein
MSGDIRRSGRPDTDAANVGRIIQTFSTLADNLVHEFDLTDLLGRVVAEAVRLLPVSGAAILVNRDNALELAASSDPELRALEEVALVNRSGPIVDAAHDPNVRAFTDMATLEGMSPSYAAAVKAAGYTAVYAMPLREREGSIGALHLFGDSGSPLSECDLQLAQALADIAAVAVVQHEQADSAVLAAQLQQALDSRIVVEQAKGVVAEHAGVDMATAFTALRSYARDRQSKLSSIARAVIDHEIRPDDVLGPH